MSALSLGSAVPGQIDRVRRESVRRQHRRQKAARGRDARVITRKARRQVDDPSDTTAVMVATGQHARACRGAERSRVEVRVAEAVRRERVEATGTLKGYRQGAPDLVVEVLSPSDTMKKVEAKVAQWLEAGARMVWVVSPKLRTVTVYRSLTNIVVLTEKDTLDGGDVVPDFQIRVAEIFP